MNVHIDILLFPANAIIRTLRVHVVTTLYAIRILMNYGCKNNFVDIQTTEIKIMKLKHIILCIIIAHHRRTGSFLRNFLYTKVSRFTVHKNTYMYIAFSSLMFTILQPQPSTLVLMYISLSQGYPSQGVQLHVHACSYALKNS